MNNDLYIKPIDFSCTGMVTASCNYNKLCISIDDAFIFDIEPLLCTGFMTDVLEKWQVIINTPDGLVIPGMEKWKDLIFGSNYTDCNDKIQRHLGIKKLWIYYAYSGYVLINPFDDTPNGLRYKSNEFSMQVPIKDLNSLSTSYRNKAVETYKNIKEFLCLNKDYFTTFDSCNCRLSCGCMDSCSCGNTKRVSSGFRYKSIKKR